MRAGERCMCGGRRGAGGAGAALAGAALLLLLLLARLPAPAAPRRPAPLRAAPAPAARAAPPAPPAPPAPQSAGARYVGGHEVAHAERCPRLGARVRVLILVSSAPSHAEARQAVRRTWAAAARRSDLALAFVLGQPPAALRPAVRAEDDLYADLVLANFRDSYANLTLKTLSMLEWADTYCPRADFLLKTDDDVFVNVPLLERFATARLNQSRSIWGRVLQNERPSRNSREKNFVPVSEFPGRLFPPFATGPAYLMSADCVGELRQAALSSQFMRLEDVFVTGILASELQLRRRHAVQFLNRRGLLDVCWLRQTIVLHNIQPQELFKLWLRLHKPVGQCNPF